MSFSSDVKQEICESLPKYKHCNLAFLSAIINYSANYTYDDLSFLSFFTEKNIAAEMIKKTIEAVFEINLEIDIIKNILDDSIKHYGIYLKDEVLIRQLLEATDLLEKKQISSVILKKECCKRNFIKGAFLICGSISNPEKTYHLEFVFENMQFAKELANIVNHFSLNAKIIERKKNYIVYLKDSENIVDLLNIMGAHANLLHFENVRVFKDVKNNLNRSNNCEIANSQKKIEASINQCENIKYIYKMKGAEYLPDQLREIAQVRMENDCASLKEIGEMLSPKVTKSGVNHRLRKINEIAENIRGGSGCF